MKTETSQAVLPATAARAGLLDPCSFEMTARDRVTLPAAAASLPPAAEIFVANLPSDALDVLVEAAADVRRGGFIPVPHIVARNIASPAALDEMLARLAGEAGVDRVLVLGGDRDEPAGSLAAAADVVRTGFLQKHGIRRAAFACYPERHPRIPEDVLDAALMEKLALAREAGIAPMLVSQFGFDAGVMVGMVRRLRQAGVTVPIRIGLAGPINHAKLLRYALRCGVGPSLRLLRDRKDVAFSMLAGETPDALVDEIATAEAADPSLAIDGFHLFTFGALAKSGQWVRDKRSAVA